MRSRPSPAPSRRRPTSAARSARGLDVIIPGCDDPPRLMSQHERPFIPIAAPVLSARELELITEAVTTHWVSSAGPFLRDFETQFAAAIGIARAEAVSSGTAALQVV